MNRLSIWLVAIVSIVYCNQPVMASGLSDQPSSILDPDTAWQVAYMHDQEKLARDVNRTFYEYWEQPVFGIIAESEQRHMDELEALMEQYGLAALAETDEPGMFGNERHLTAFIGMVGVGKDSLIEAFQRAAYLEEWDIQEFQASAESTVEDPLNDAYRRLMLSAYRHIRLLVRHMNKLGHNYQAQHISQPELDAILEDDSVFLINSGLNDTWVNPAAPGQGFIFSVLPVPGPRPDGAWEPQGNLFLALLTFDTQPAGTGVSAALGGPNQRWITGLGVYSANFVVGRLELTTGGMFNSSTPVPKQVADYGSFMMLFEDCDHAAVTIRIPSLGLEEEIGLSRATDHNSALCEALSLQ